MSLNGWNRRCLSVNGSTLERQQFPGITLTFFSQCVGLMVPRRAFKLNRKQVCEVTFTGTDFNLNETKKWGQFKRDLL